MVMTTVEEILREKGDQVWTVVPDSTVYQALSLMAEKNVGALVVIDRDGVAGILSERDYARKVILQGKSSKEIRVRDIMSSPVQCVNPASSIEECMALMTDRHVRHLPVVRDERLAGLISIGDVVKAIISQQGSLIRDLEGYITGRR